MVIGWVRGGRLGGLGRLPPKGLPLLGVAVLFMIAARLQGMPPKAALALLGAGYFGALIVLWQNRDRPWVVVVLVGVVLNGLVMLANGGRMPVSPPALAQAGGNFLPAGPFAVPPRYLVVTPSTVLAALGDSLPVRIGSYGAVLSPGDLLVALGLTGIVQAQMRADLERGSNPA